jgi:hypothetical protein
MDEKWHPALGVHETARGCRLSLAGVTYARVFGPAPTPHPTD